MTKDTSQNAQRRRLFLYLSIAIISFLSGRNLSLSIDEQERFISAVPRFESNPRNAAKTQVVGRSPSIQRRLEFVHIPKTGGTAIESYASVNNITWSICHFGIAKNMVKISNNMTHCAPDALKHYWPKEPKFNACPWWHVPPSHIQAFFPEHNPYQGADLFCVVRNPYERIISEYYYANNNQKNDPNQVDQFNARIFQQLSQYSSAMRPGDTARKIPGNDVYFRSSGHFIPQYDFVYNDHHERLIQHVLHFENLKPEFDALMESYGIPLRLPNEKYRFSAQKELGVHRRIFC